MKYNHHLYIAMLPDDLQLIVRSIIAQSLYAIDWELAPFLSSETVPEIIEDAMNSRIIDLQDAPCFQTIIDIIMLYDTVNDANIILDPYFD